MRSSTPLTSAPSRRDRSRQGGNGSFAGRPEFLTAAPNTSLLLERARAMFTELIQLAHHLRSISRPSGQVLPGPSVEEIRQRLLARVEEQTRLEGAPRGSLQERQLEQCRYVLATFADELLVNTSWYGRDAWREGLLEDVLFGTHHAGERIFTDIQRLLQDRDPTQADMAAVYLLALALGFQGRYRDQGEEVHLHEVQRQLFVLAYQRPPAPDAPSHRLLPQAYAYTLDDRADRRLSPRWPWAAAIAAVLLVLVPTSFAVRAARAPAAVTPQHVEIRP